MSDRRAFILCEGYTDRAFWAGALCVHFGCRDLKDDPPRESMGKGKFAFGTGDLVVVVQPVDGEGNLSSALATKLDGRSTKPFDFLIVSRDADGARDAAEAAVDGTLSRRGDTFTKTGSVRVLEDGAKILPFTWTSPDFPDANDDLERLLRHAIQVAYPPRTTLVSSWQASSEFWVAKRDRSKSFAYMLMAGWHADRGCEQFYRAVWDDAAIRDALLTLLGAVPGWTDLESLLGVDSHPRA